jgi:ABC-type sugar transport system ATPase subunit
MIRALSCRNVTKALSGRPVIAALNRDVEPPEVVALLGGSGFWKTTLLRLITGLLNANRGYIAIGDRMVFGGSQAVPPEWRAVDMVFQNYALWPHMSVAGNLAFGLAARGPTRQEIDGRVSHALGATQLLPYRDRLPAMLSGGEQQRVAIARCLSSRPSLVLFDEPLSNLDAALGDDVRAAILHLVRSEDRPAIYVTHDQTQALAVSDRLAVMRAGRIEQFDRPQVIYDGSIKRLRGMFHGRPFAAAGRRHAGLVYNCRPAALAPGRKRGVWSCSSCGAAGGRAGGAFLGTELSLRRSARQPLLGLPAAAGDRCRNRDQAPQAVGRRRSGILPAARALQVVPAADEPAQTSMRKVSDD